MRTTHEMIFPFILYVCVPLIILIVAGILYLVSHKGFRKKDIPKIKGYDIIEYKMSIDTQITVLTNVINKIREEESKNRGDKLYFELDHYIIFAINDIVKDNKPHLNYIPLYNYENAHLKQPQYVYMNSMGDFSWLDNDYYNRIRFLQWMIDVLYYFKLHKKNN